MAGSNVVFNIARGKLGYYAELPGTNDALIAVLLKSSGLEDDATLVDHDTLSSLLAGTSDECDFTNYARQTLSGVTSTVDDSSNVLDIDSDNISWATAGGAANNTIGKLVVCYDPDTTGGTDADIIPLSAHSYDETTSGTTLVITIPSGGFLRSA